MRRHFLRGLASAAAIVLLSLSAGGASATYNFGVLRPVDQDLRAYSDAGITRVTLELGWDLFEPDQGSLSSQYLKWARDRIELFESHDFDIVLDLGLQYPPDWVFDLPGETRFINQHGVEWHGPLGSDVPNAVHNAAVRNAQSSYLKRAIRALGQHHFVGVRVGGLLQNEVRYPPSVGGGQSFWAFGGAAESQSPVPEWRTGLGYHQNQEFAHFYVESLSDYAVWLTRQYDSVFAGSKYVLLPGWGLRPGDLQQAVAEGLEGSTSAEINGLITNGVDFAMIAEALEGTSNVILYTTYLDAPTQGSTQRLVSPIEYLAALAEKHAHETAGENSGDNSRISAMEQIEERLKAGIVSDIMWLSGNSLRTSGNASLSDYRSLIRRYQPTRDSESAGSPGPCKGTFCDDETSPFVDEIEKIAAVGITKGCNPPANDNFCPRDNVTRGAMAAFLVRALNLPISNAKDFVDDDGSVFEKDIESMAAAGITRGCNPPKNSMYCPISFVTRGEMAAFLSRAFDYSTTPSIDFIDDDGSIFENAIEAIAAQKITRGCNPPANDMFCPRDYVTREQMAAFLARALNLDD